MSRKLVRTLRYNLWEEKMYCGQCGTENTEGSAFCRNCGARLTAPQTLRSANSSQWDAGTSPLFESRGSTSGFTVMSVAEFLVGAAVLVLAIVWQTRLNSFSNAVERFLPIFWIVLSPLLVVLGVYHLHLAPRMWIKLYSDRVEGYGCNVISGFGSTFEAPYGRVERVSTRPQSPGVLQLKLNDGKFIVPCQDLQRALGILRSRVRDVRA